MKTPETNRKYYYILSILLLLFCIFSYITVSQATISRTNIDGRITSTLGGFTMPGTTRAGLPTAGDTGTVARVTDGDKSLWMDMGTQWFSLFGRTVDVQAYNAKGDGVSDDRTAIQNAIDAVSGGGRVVIPDTGTDYMVSGDLTVSGNIVIEWLGSGSFLKITANTTGGFFSVAANSHVTFINPRIDGGGPTLEGQNLIGAGGAGAVVKIFGGHLRNAYRGSGDGTGGKAISIDGYGATVIADGVTIDTCFMAISLKRDLGGTDTSTTSYLTGSFSNIYANSCNIFAHFQLRNIAITHANVINGLMMKVSLNNFVAKDCGSEVAPFLFSRASNASISNGLISGSSSVGAIFKGRGSRLNIDNVTVSQNATSIIDIDPYGTAQGALANYAEDTSAMKDNYYKINATGTYGRVYLSDTTDATHANRFLDNSIIDVSLGNDVSTGIVTPATRNGTTQLRVQKGTSAAVASASRFNTYIANMAAVAANEMMVFNGLNIYGHIKFPATQVASSDLNTLDDYEEGTWSPVYEGSTGTIGTTAYTTQIGRYIKIGKNVTLTGQIVLTDKGSWTGNVLISGLPFSHETGFFSIGTFYGSKLTFTGNYLTTGLGVTSGYDKISIQIGTNDGTSSSLLQTAGVAANSTFNFTLTYRASS